MRHTYIKPQTEIIMAYGDVVLAALSATNSQPSGDDPANMFAPEYDFDDEDYGRV
ncbi:MAG: hypothetical protein ACI4V5_02115 [Prevotella sp.]